MSSKGRLSRYIAVAVHPNRSSLIQHGRQIMQAVILILEDEHSPDVKEQALCILANIADGETAKEFIMSNEDVLRKLTNYMVYLIFIN